MNCPEITEQEADEVYDWVDRVPLSRPKKNINRDLSDGILVYQIVTTLVQTISNNIDLPPSNNVTVKLNNWNILNQKVFKKINFQVSKPDIDHIITQTPMAIERVLKQLEIKINTFLKKKDQPNKQLIQLRKIAQSQRFRNKVQQTDNDIMQLKQVVNILQNKLNMMQELVKLKDRKIQTLVDKLQAAHLL